MFAAGGAAAHHVQHIGARERPRPEFLGSTDRRSEQCDGGNSFYNPEFFDPSAIPASIGCAACKTTNVRTLPSRSTLTQCRGASTNPVQHATRALPPVDLINPQGFEICKRPSELRLKTFVQGGSAYSNGMSTSA
jgi:hypothetical protein